MGAGSGGLVFHVWRTRPSSTERSDSVPSRAHARNWGSTGEIAILDPGVDPPSRLSRGEVPPHHAAVLVGDHEASPRGVEPTGHRRALRCRRDRDDAGVRGASLRGQDADRGARRVARGGGCGEEGQGALGELVDQCLATQLLEGIRQSSLRLGVRCLCFDLLVASEDALTPRLVALTRDPANGDHTRHCEHEQCRARDGDRRGVTPRSSAARAARASSGARRRACPVWNRRRSVGEPFAPSDSDRSGRAPSPSRRSRRARPARPGASSASGVGGAMRDAPRSSSARSTHLGERALAR